MKTCKTALVLSLMFGNSAWAAISCNVSAPSLGVLHTGAAVDDQASVTFTCTRDPSNDPNSISYRIVASEGLWQTAAQPIRRARLGTTTSYVPYSLRRGAGCNNNTNWRSTLTVNNSAIRGTLTFAAGSSTAFVTLPYCVRLRSTGSPAAGVYTDTFNVWAMYPDTAGSPLTPAVAVTYSVGVTNQCIFNTLPSAMSFNYTAFGPVQTQAQNFDLRCSNLLPWTLSISPASNVLLGLNYSIAASPASGTGTGADQVITLTGTIPAGQAGTCATAGCSATQAHVVTITY